jgi:hypothetical protein
MSDPLREGIARALKNHGAFTDGPHYVDEMNRRWWIADVMYDIDATFVTEVTVRSPDTNRSRTFRITEDEKEKA